MVGLLSPNGVPFPQLDPRRAAQPQATPMMSPPATPAFSGGTSPMGDAFSSSLRDVFAGLAMGSTPQESMAMAGRVMTINGGQRAKQQQTLAQQNRTVQWLKSQGIDDNTASYLASDPVALRAHVAERQRLGRADWQIHKMDDGSSWMIDMHDPTRRNKISGPDPMAAESKMLDLEKKRRDAVGPPETKVVKQADGSEVAVQWDRDKQTWVPMSAPEGGNPVASPKLTEQQSKDVGFYNRGSKLLPVLEQQDKALTDVFSAAGANSPIGSNFLKSDAFRQAEQTGRELLAVILRKDTGAAVTPQEYNLYGDIYLPKPGDDPATIQQKREARRTAMEGLRMGLGTADIIFRSREAAEAAKKQGAGPVADSGGGWTDFGGVKIRRKQ